MKTRRRDRPKTDPLVERTMERLKAYCDAGGRQIDVAQALLVDQSQVSRWIVRGGQPRLVTFLRLIEFLDRQVQPDEKNEN